MPRSRARSARPLTNERAGRMAMYSKNESMPPGRNNRVIAASKCSTSSTEKLFSGKPDTTTS